MQAWTKDMLIDPAYKATNIHPNWRALYLSSCKMVRQFIRDKRHAGDGKTVLRGYQRDMLATRRQLAAYRAANP